MKFSEGCCRLRLAVLVIGASWLTGCVTAGFDAGGVAACPPVVEYSTEFQAQAAEELAILPENSATAEMMADYTVMREQARACTGALASQQHQSSVESGPFMCFSRRQGTIRAGVASITEGISVFGVAGGMSGSRNLTAL